MLDKRLVLDALIAQLAGVAARAANAARTTREGATHAEAKPENDKDTRALEQSYLARGQAIRVEELVEQIEQLRSLPLRSFGQDDAIAAGALLALESDGGTRWLFLAPHGGGVELKVAGVSITVITPQSALGAAVLGRFAGDDVELRTRGLRREYVIASVH